MLARRMLEKAGYKVLEAEDTEHAIRISEEHDGTIDLLLTDVVMPKMGGWQVAQRVRSRWPDVGVLYMSGYMDDTIARRGDFGPLLEKPFTRAQLVTAVEKQLEGVR